MFLPILTLIPIKILLVWLQDVIMKVMVGCHQTDPTKASLSKDKCH